MSAATDASTTTANSSASKLRRISSSANITPAIGALKVAEMPPAAPHATSRRSRAGGTRTSWPTVEPSAEPICTIGPSRPTDPPEPMQSAEASGLDDRDLRADAAAALGDGEHDLGHAVAARLGREARDQRAVQEAADDGATTTNAIPSHGTCGFATRPTAL